ncbi:MAG TPA: hypothetical protein VFV33_26855, partial [Gemmatimonadaceae bacterium]|nr:hypothetical protein [Gemmatimonadaceae bacterium]
MPSRRWLPTALWAAVILAVTSVPATSLPAGPQIPGLDKVVHGVMYGVLGYLVGEAVRGER